MTDNKTLYTAKDLSELAKVSDAYIRRLLKLGTIKGVKLGNTWAITQREVDRYLETRKEQA